MLLILGELAEIHDKKESSFCKSLLSFIMVIKQILIFHETTSKARNNSNYFLQANRVAYFLGKLLSMVENSSYPFM